MSHFPHSSDDYPYGPRDWSPRMDFAIRMIERIRKVIPKELLIEEGFVHMEGGFASRVVDNVYSYNVKHNEVFVHERQKVMFLVKLGKTVEEVCLTSRGGISMGTMVIQLLDGILPGYEYLGEKNPFRTTEAGGPA